MPLILQELLACPCRTSDFNHGQVSIPPAGAVDLINADRASFSRETGQSFLLAH